MKHDQKWSTYASTTQFKNKKLPIVFNVSLSSTPILPLVTSAPYFPEVSIIYLFFFVFSCMLSFNQFLHTSLNNILLIFSSFET